MPPDPLHSTTRLLLQVITGGVVSRTVTVKEHWLALVCASLAVQFTVVVPSAKLEPDAGVQVTDGSESHWSVAVVA